MGYYKKEFEIEDKLGNSQLSDRQIEDIEDGKCVRVDRANNSWLNGGVKSEKFNW